MASAAVGSSVSVVGGRSTAGPLPGVAVPATRNPSAALCALFCRGFGRAVFYLYRSFRDHDNLRLPGAGFICPAPTRVAGPDLLRHAPDRVRLRTRRYRIKPISLAPLRRARILTRAGFSADVLLE